MSDVAMDGQLFISGSFARGAHGNSRQPLDASRSAASNIAATIGRFVAAVLIVSLRSPQSPARSICFQSIRSNRGYDNEPVFPRRGKIAALALANATTAALLQKFPSISRLFAVLVCFPARSSSLPSVAEYEGSYAALEVDET